MRVWGWIDFLDGGIVGLVSWLSEMDVAWKEGGKGRGRIVSRSSVLADKRVSTHSLTDSLLFSPGFFVAWSLLS